MPGKLIKAQYDPFLKLLVTKVKECRAASEEKRNANEKEVKEETKPVKKPAKGGPPAESAAAAPGSASSLPLYEVVLEETILFPEGGGQPSDTGSINDCLVTYIYRNAEGSVVHQVRSAAPFVAGSEVTIQVDWNRRFDHMQHHSGQHLISALAIKIFNAETKSWWLAKDSAECHIEFGVKQLNEAQLQELEDACNDAIRESRPMKAHVYANMEEAMKDENFRSRKVTKDSEDNSSDLHGELRLIEIQGLDLNACCGTHMLSTGQIQLVKFTRTQTARGNTRLFFVAGNRAIQLMGKMIKRERDLVSVFSTTPEQAIEFTKNLSVESRATNKLLKAVQSELAVLIAEKMVQSIGDADNQVLSLHREEESFPIADVADVLQEKKPNVIAFLSVGNPKGPGQFLLVGPEQKVGELSTEVAKLLSGRGGGRKGRFQGKTENLAQIPAVLQYLKSKISS